MPFPFYKMSHKDTGHSKMDIPSCYYQWEPLNTWYGPELDSLQRLEKNIPWIERKNIELNNLPCPVLIIKVPSLFCAKIALETWAIFIPEVRYGNEIRRCITSISEPMILYKTRKGLIVIQSWWIHIQLWDYGRFEFYMRNTDRTN